MLKIYRIVIERHSSPLSSNERFALGRCSNYRGGARAVLGARAHERVDYWEMKRTHGQTFDALSLSSSYIICHTSTNFHGKKWISTSHLLHGSWSPLLPWNLKCSLPRTSMEMRGCDKTFMEVRVPPHFHALPCISMKVA